MTGTWIEIICYLITLTRDDEVRGGGGLKVAVPAQEAEIVNGSEGRARIPYGPSCQPRAILYPPGMGLFSYKVRGNPQVLRVIWDKGSQSSGYAEPIVYLSCVAQGSVLDSTHEILKANALVPIQRRTTEMGEASTY